MQQIILKDKLTKMFAALIILNLLDGIFTLLWLQIGLAVEANPIMAYFYHISPVAFLVAKLFLIYAGVYVFVKYQQTSKTLVALGVSGLVAVYTMIISYHILGVFITIYG